MQTVLLIIAVVAIGCVLYFNSNEKRFHRVVDQLYQWEQANIRILIKEQEEGKISLEEFIKEKAKYEKIFHDGWNEAFKKYMVK